LYLLNQLNKLLLNHKGNLLSKTTREMFNDKVSLIYEYDNKSPLFVRKANVEIENNNLDAAVEIFNSGLKLYPQYAAAYLVLGKAQILKGDYNSALKNIKIGSDLIHSNKTYNFYLKEIEEIKKQRSLFNMNRRNAFMLSDETVDVKQREVFTDVEDEKESHHNSASSITESVEQFTLKNSIGKRTDYSYPDEDANEFSTINFEKDNLIVSETLAKIYITQGEYKEAMKVYVKLAKKSPNKKDYYYGKIEELRSQVK